MLYFGSANSPAGYFARQINMNQQDTSVCREADWQAAEEALLERVKAVARAITERVRKLTADTDPQIALPSDPTDVSPPVPDPRNSN